MNYPDKKGLSSLEMIIVASSLLIIVGIITGFSISISGSLIKDQTYRTLSTDISSCSELNTPNEIYTLTQDITHSSDIVCFNITADNITLDCRGHNITNTQSDDHYGIYILERNNITIKNCNIINETQGIYLNSSSNNTLINNTANNNSYCGFYVYNSSNNIITNNTANSNYGSDWISGIYLENSNNNIIIDNLAKDNDGYGISTAGSNNNTFINNIANNNILGIDISLSSNNILINNTANNNNYGIFIGSSSNNILINNTANNNDYGISTSVSNNNTFINNIANNNSNYGISIAKSNNNTFINNIANNNSHGIDIKLQSKNNILINNTANNNSDYGIIISSSQNNILTNNTANNNNYGIFISLSSNNILINNTANNNNYGISTPYSNNNTFINNIVYNNIRGFYIYLQSKDNTLINNTANNNSYGIFIGFSSNNSVLINNTINNNSNYGIYIESSSNNTIENNIINNSNYYGIWINSSSNNNTISNNRIENTLSNNSIYIKNSNDCKINSNIIFNSSLNGIKVENSSGIKIFENNISNISEWGISLNISYNSSIENNTLFENQNGILFEYSNGNITNNNITNHKEGLRLHLSAGLIKSNIISNNERGLLINQSSDCQTEANTIYNNNIGLQLFDATSIKLSNDNLKNNSIDFISENSTYIEPINISFNNNLSTIIFRGNLSIDSIESITDIPEGKAPFKNFLNITNLSQDAWLAINYSYNSDEIIQKRVIEKTLKMYKNTSEGWTDSFGDINDIDLTAKVIYANISSMGGIFSVFGNSSEIKNCKNITEPETFYLASDLSGNQSYGVCIEIKTDNVTLDCNNHILLGENQASTKGIKISNFKNITLKNCNISNYEVGLFIDNSNLSNIQNCSFNSNSYGILLSNSAKNNSFNETKFASNSISGIYLNGSDSNNFTNIYISGNDIAFYSTNTALNNLVKKLKLENGANVNFESKDIILKKGYTPDEDLPNNLKALYKFILLNNTSSTSWIFINISYTDDEIEDIKEDTLKIVKYYNESWDTGNSYISNRGLNKDENYVYANITSLNGGIFVPVGEIIIKTPSTPPSESKTTSTFTPPNYEIKNWDRIKAYEKAYMILSLNNTPVTKIEFSVKNETNKASLKFTKLDYKPNNITQPSGTVYNWFSIEPNNLVEDNLFEVKFSFRVEKEWVNLKRVSPNYITLARWSKGTWNELSTSLVKNDSSFYYYEAYSPGFSYFVIETTTPKVQETLPKNKTINETPIQTPPQTEYKPSPVKTESNIMGIIMLIGGIVLGIGIIVGLVIFYIKTREETPSPLPPLPYQQTSPQQYQPQGLQQVPEKQEKVYAIPKIPPLPPKEHYLSKVEIKTEKTDRKNLPLEREYPALSKFLKKLKK